MKNKKTTLPILLAAVLLLSACSNGSRHTASGSLTPAPTSTSAPTPFVPNSTTPTPALTSDPQTTTTETPSPEPTQEPLPVPEDTGCNTASMYLNYNNSFPLTVTKTHEIEFHYDDTITIRDLEGTAYSVALSTDLVVDGMDLSDADAWYFCGALVYENMIYAHYDYLNNTDATPSLLIRLDPDTQSVSCCIASTNPRKTITDSFALAGDRIYYTVTRYSGYGTATTDIFSTDLQGSDTVTFLTGVFSETIPYLTSDGTTLYYAASDIDSISRLIAINPADGAQQVIAKNIGQIDFLSVLGDYLLTSLQNNVLTYYSLTTSTRSTLSVSTDSSLTAGFLMTDGATLYIPLISYASNASTLLAQINLSANSVTKVHTIDSNYYYCVGMINRHLYAENVDHYVLFDLTSLGL